MSDAVSVSALARAAEKLVREVGRDLAARASALGAALSSEGRDIKLAADLEAERALIAGLTEISPLPILSEEAGWTPAAPAGADDLYWLVDPLDGSFNYHRGLPACCIAVALCKGMTPLVGVIHDFLRDETFAAAVGEGATLNGRPIHVADADRGVEQAVLMTGFPVRADLSPERMAALGGELARWKKVRMIGSAATSLAYVGCGRADAYREDGISWWDVAAGLVIVSEAGGAVSVSGNDPLAPVRIFACAPGLRAESGIG